MAEMRERHRAMHRHTKPQKIAHLSDRKSTNNLAMQLRRVAGDPTSTSYGHVAHTRAAAPVMPYGVLHAPPTARCHNLHNRTANATALWVYTGRKSRLN